MLHKSDGCEQGGGRPPQSANIFSYKLGLALDHLPPKKNVRSLWQVVAANKGKDGCSREFVRIEQTARFGFCVHRVGGAVTACAGGKSPARAMPWCILRWRSIRLRSEVSFIVTIRNYWQECCA